MGGGESLSYDKITYDPTDDNVYIKSGYDTSIYWKIDGEKLYLRATPKENYKERVLLNDSQGSKNGWIVDEKATSVTTAIIEEKITPLYCTRFFHEMTALKDIVNFDMLDVSCCQSLFCMFQSCSSLTSIGDLSNWDVSNVTGMSYMFNKCSSLTSIGDLSNWNVSNVTDMRATFNECSSLNKIDVSNCNVSNVTDMSYMFNSCLSLTSIGDLSNWDVSKVTDMSYMFACRIDSGIGAGPNTLGDLSNWKLNKNGVKLSYFLYFMHNLEDISWLKNWDMSCVTDIDGMLCECRGPKTDLKFIENWDVSNVVGDEGFYRTFDLLGAGADGNFKFIDDTFTFHWNLNPKVHNLGRFCHYTLGYKTIDMSEMDFANITYMGEAFVKNKSQIIKFGKNLREDMNVVNIFVYQYSLKELHFLEGTSEKAWQNVANQKPVTVFVGDKVYKKINNVWTEIDPTTLVSETSEENNITYEASSPQQ